MGCTTRPYELVWTICISLDATSQPAQMNRHKITTARRVGEVSSKYGYQPELFERDLEQHAAESEALWQDFRAWMIERKVDPEKLRFLFLRLWEEFLE